MADFYTYSGNVYDSAAAGTTTFALTSSAGNAIPYLQRSHIHVYLSDDDGGTWSEQARPAAWDFDQAATSIVLVTGITAGQWVRVLRITPVDVRYVDFADGTLLTAGQLDQGEDYSRYCDQEQRDQLAIAISNAVIYKGTIDLTVDNAPPNPLVGWSYFNTGSGTVIQGGNPGWVGIVGDAVTGSERVIYNNNNEWEIVQTPISQKGVLEVTGTAPIQVDNTDAQRPVVSVDAATTTAAGVITEAASDNVTYGRENGAWVAVANTAVSANPPANPSNGDGWYDLNTGRLYLWINDGDSSQWAEANPGLAGGGASVEVDDTPPTNPSDGDLWWDSSDDSGRLYVFYEDGSTNQWVEASPPAAANPTVKVSDTAPANPEPGDLWWDSSETGGDNGGRLYFRYSDGDSVQWVQTSNVGGANGQIWGRTGTTIEPATAGDGVDLGTGDISGAAATFTGDLSAAAGTFSGALNAAGRIQNIVPDTTTSLLDLRSATGGANTRKFHVASDGTLGIGGTNAITSPNIALNAVGSASFSRGSDTVGITPGWGGSGALDLINTTGNGDLRIRCGSNNGVDLAPGASAWVASSDIRLKRNLEPIADGLNKVSQLRAFVGQYVTDEPGVSRAFLAAQDVQQVLPQAVYGSEDNLKLAYTEVIPLLVSALHDAKARIEALEARLATLEGN